MGWDVADGISEVQNRRKLPGTGPARKVNYFTINSLGQGYLVLLMRSSLEGKKRMGQLFCSKRQTKEAV